MAGVPIQMIGKSAFICNECVDLCSEIVEKKHSSPDPVTKQAQIRLEELKELRADVARLHGGLTKLEEKLDAMMET